MINTEEYNKDKEGGFNLYYKAYQYVLVGLVLGSVFPIVAWLVDILYRNITISVEGLKEMHLTNPLLFVVDLAPIVLAIIAFYFGRFVDEKEKRLKEENTKQEKYLTKISKFFDEISRGNYNANFEGEESDEMIRKLVVMRDKLKVSSAKEFERNWRITGRDIISSVLRKYNNIEDLSYYTLLEIIKYSGLIQGSFYLFDKKRDLLYNVASYAYDRRKFIKQEIPIGKGLIGEVAYEKEYIYRKEIPENYISISSGILGDKKPGAILLVPLISDDKLQGVIEFATIEDEISPKVIQFITSLSEVIGQTIFNILINERTANLLKESQEMTAELQENEEELRQNAEEILATQEELEETNKSLAEKVREVENSQSKLNALLENASEVISILDKDGIIKYESPSTINILGYHSEERVGKYAFDNLGDNRSLLEELFEKVKKNPFHKESVEFIYRQDGADEIWFEVTAVNLLNNESIEGFIFNTIDITQRKIAEEEQRRRGQMQALSENSKDIILRIGSDSKKIFYLNPAFVSYTGVQEKEALNKTITDIELPNGLQMYFITAIEEINKNPINTEQEFILEVQGKEVRTMKISAIPEFSENKELETVLFVAHDITEEKLIELEIKDKNKKITESINYAKKIQNAILPDSGALYHHFKDSFIFYKPKDVVSGDFPWLFEKGDNVYIAAVDCTGHGVPGALLSFVGYFILQNIVDHDRELTASQVCDKLHQGVRRTLRQDQEGANARDGMDIALCKYNRKKNILEYAGAHRPLYLLRNGEIEIFKGDRKAIGGIPYKKKQEKDFTNYVINIEEKDKIFFFSDGLPDQVGEETKKKYQARRMREIIVENSDLSMLEYSEYFSRDFEEYKGQHKQIDDILLIGIGF